MTHPEDEFGMGDDDTYRLAPPEPTPPSDGGESSSPFDEHAPAQRPRRKKRRREKTEADSYVPADEIPPVPPEGAPDWVADTGWRDRHLISAVWYPLTGSGWYLLPIYSVLLALAVVPIVGSLIAAVGAIFASSLLLVTANYTLEGIPSGPQFPDVLSWDAISASLMGLIAFMISGLPAVVGILVMSRFGAFSPLTLVVLIAAGFFYVPMGFLTLALEQNEAALNPKTVFRGIRQMLLPYVLLWSVAAGTFVSLLAVVHLNLHEKAFPPCLAFAFVYIATSFLRGVALLARKRELSFDDSADAA